MIALLLALAATAATAAPPAPAPQDVLRSALECREIPDGIDAALTALNIPFDAARTSIAPLQIHGSETREVSVFREGGTDLYTSYFAINAIDTLVERAALTRQDDGSFLGKTTLGEISLELEGDHARMRCTVAFDY